MAYTVKQVATMSNVSVRTLHFYDETGLLKPAYHKDNGYRFYGEPQLLALQQILFYRELGFELKQIKQILDRAEFEKIDALESHRKILQKKLDRTRTLIGTIDKTIMHVKGKKKMKNKEMFVGFNVAVGKDRFDERVNPRGTAVAAELRTSENKTPATRSTASLCESGTEWVYVFSVVSKSECPSNA
jgi:DNA-binding transcriptional MerR regulator